MGVPGHRWHATQDGRVVVFDMLVEPDA
jgi:hypothetical protein